jgi:hypothetical protein
MKREERIVNWLCEFNDYDGTALYPQITASDGGTIVDLECGTITIEWEEKSDTMLGTTTRRVTVPAAVIRQLLEFWSDR